MPAFLLDVNVWVAAVFAAHPAHHSAQAVLIRATPAAPALICRATQQSFLRLVSTPAIFTAYQAAAITNQDALAALEAFQALPQVDLVDEPIGMEGLWWRLAGLAVAAPKRWMDAYLAAFAISSSTRMVTLDQDFCQFLGAGLDLELLQADSHGGG
ncbi:TA system VapC family ribonuclease toxin [Synechococcus sp. BA-132 BA5]|uniref:TA system VapC family ribonuclease toxin n=1 Tax=Synechococcus sp. BA-132 BA5 TaxID=3110252 RepID=UPI002B1F73C8|nr:TA system VapC family ribonuclease toxin [Synechococcus sp. BA-132 BA5]MEA5416496.1 TA system VapC family ribonuclease toxin [Synechococcus sp. BA-132 BA5]